MPSAARAPACEPTRDPRDTGESSSPPGHRRPTLSENRVVLKFGGTSVASAERWHAIADIARARVQAGDSVVLVVSALAGISNRLDALPAQALAGAGNQAVMEIEEVHRALVASGGVGEDVDLSEEFATVRRLAEGIALVGEATPKVRAELMAQGELMSSRIGRAILEHDGLRVLRLDARDLLESRPDPERGPGARYLSAECDPSPDARVQSAMTPPPGGVVLTQGFIARDPDGSTVLLGRGGSDLSAAYFAAKLAASRLELWSDVPGVFTANPKVVPGARLIRRLAYDEAQEIASAGATVIHPRCIPALRDARIPIHLKSTLQPQLDGGIIEWGGEEDGARLKAISSKPGVVLVSMETIGMWQQVGFLAAAFERFRDHGLSVDLVSTSETNVTVSLDRAANALAPEGLRALAADLSAICRVRIIEGCSAVTLVGRRIRALLHRLAPALEVFEEARVHLVSQAANDLNITFVVEEEEADRLVQRLHDLFFGAAAGELVWLGPSWEEVRAGRTAPSTVPDPWWIDRREELLALGGEQEAAYVYAADEVRAAARRVLGIPGVDRALYAMKANDHVEVLRIIAGEGLGLECVSPGELARARAAAPDLAPADVLFTPNFVARTEFEGAFEFGATVTLDGVYPLVEWPELFHGRGVLLRVDPGSGHGHHEKVRTGGSRAKFGIALDTLPRAAEAAAAAGARVIGLHAHAGSGILDASHWARVATLLAEEAERFPDVTVLNVGGGFGVPDRRGLSPLDLDAIGRGLAEVRAANPGRAIWVEPGRYLVAGAGVLLARVTQVKRKGDTTYVGVATGMNALIRPALYGAHHDIVNLTRLGEPATETTTVVGPICESGDRLGVDRWLPPCREGDVMLIADAGAYGRVMSSTYNRREPPVEVVI